MKQQQFEAQYRTLWTRFDHLLAKANSKKSDKSSRVKKDKAISDSPAELFSSNLYDKASGYEFVKLYRIICQHYALAKQRHYSPQLVQYL